MRSKGISSNRTQVVRCTYFTVREGVASVNNTIMYAQYYFSAFLVYPFLYLEKRYGSEKSFMESWLPIAALHQVCWRYLILLRKAEYYTNTGGY